MNINIDTSKLACILPYSGERSSDKMNMDHLKQRAPLILSPFGLDFFPQIKRAVRLQDANVKFKHDSGPFHVFLTVRIH
jgi:hypothetical protein